MALFLPRRWQRQPSGNVVQLRDPYAGTMRFGYCGWAGEWIHADVGTATIGGTAALAHDTCGKVFRVATTDGGTTDRMEWPTSTRFDPPATGWTMAVVCRRYATASANYTAIFHRDIAFPLAAGEYGIMCTSSADKAAAPYSYVYASNVGYTPASGSLSSITYERLMLTHNGTAATFWRNGNKVETVTVANPASSSLTMRLGAGTGEKSIAVNVEMAFLDGRLWSEAEIRQWSNERYSIFAPVQAPKFYIEVVAGAGNAIAVPAGSLTLTANAPTVTATAHQTIAVPAGALTLTANAPTVTATDHQTIAVPAGALTLTGHAPTVSVSADQVVQVPAGTLAITGHAPTVAATDHQTIAVPAGALTLTGYAPNVTVAANQTIQVPAGTLALTGFAPTVLAVNPQTIVVPLGTLTLTGYAPTVTALIPAVFADDPRNKPRVGGASLTPREGRVGGSTLSGGNRRVGPSSLD